MKMPQMKWMTALFFLFINILPVYGVEYASASSSEEWQVTLTRSQVANEKVKKLVWDAEEFSIDFQKVGFEVKPVVNLTGKFTREDWGLVWDKEHLIDPKTNQTEFSFVITLTEEKTPLQLVAVGPKEEVEMDDQLVELGEIETEKITLEVKDWEKLKQELEKQRVKRYSIMAALGLTSLTYQETGTDSKYPTYNMIGLTAKGSYQYLLVPQRWDFVASSFFTVLPIMDNLTNISGRFFGLNLRAGYTVPYVKDPWKLMVLGGLYYTTTIVSSNEFGFKHMTGPQIYPLVQRTLNNGDLVSAYFKFSPVASGFGLLSLSSREIAFGGGFTHWLNNGHPLHLLLDFSNIQISIENQKSTATTFTLSSGYGW